MQNVVTVPVWPSSISSAVGTPSTGQAGRGGQDVQVNANKLAPNFYALQANGLSTVGVLTGPDGVLMVDAGTPALTDKIVAAIKQVSDRPIRFLINTHVHADHTGGNENFGKMGVTILSRDALLEMTRLGTVVGRSGTPYVPDVQIASDQSGSA